MELESVVNINLHSDHALKFGDTYIFDLHNVLRVVGKTVHASITDFQSPNSVYNINSSNNEFLGIFIEQGFYKISNLQKIISSILLNNSRFEFVKIRFNETTLKFEFKSEFPFTLTGTLLNFLNIEDGNSVLVGDEYKVVSKYIVDIYKNAHNLRILSPNLKSRNVSVNTDKDHTHEKLGVVPIKVNFGEYIIHQDQNSMRSVLYENVISRIEIKIVNDFGTSVLDNTIWSLTLKLEIYDNGAEDGYIDDLVANKQGILENIHYPIIYEEPDLLKDAREMYQENVLKKQRRTKWSEILKSIRLKKKDKK